jgi:phage terminase Nu1 subunit (DNA packaging protein)
MDNIMVAPAHVAERDKVTKQAVTKLVRDLAEKSGLPVERDGRGRIVRFSLAHFDHLRERFASSEKVSAARTASSIASAQKPSTISAENSRDEALRQEAWLKVGRERLRQQEDAGNLVRADMLAEALARAGREIQSMVARLPNSADDLAIAVSKEGAHGLRVALREKAFEVNTKIAEVLANLAVQARDHDPAIEETEA